MPIDFNKGFVAFPRGLTSWEWYDDINTSRLYVHLLLTSNWEEKQWHGVTIPPGGRVTSVQKLVSETGLTTKQVRTSLLKLIETNYVTIKTTNKFSVITIENYSLVVGLGEQKGKQRANKGQTEGKQRATTKPLKQLKPLKQSSSSSPSGDSEDAKMTTITPESFWVSSGLGKRCSPVLKAALEEYRAAGVEDALILQAMREIEKRDVKSPYPYLRTILDKAVSAGQLTLDAWQAGRRPSGGAKPRVDRETPSGNDFLKNAGKRRPLKKSGVEKREPPCTTTPRTTEIPPQEPRLSGSPEKGDGT